MSIMPKLKKPPKIFTNVHILEGFFNGGAFMSLVELLRSKKNISVDWSLLRLRNLYFSSFWEGFLVFYEKYLQKLLYALLLSEGLGEWRIVLTK